MIPQQEIQKAHQNSTVKLQQTKQCQESTWSLNKQNLTIGIFQLLRELNYQQTLKALKQEASFELQRQSKLEIKSQRTLPSSLQSTPNKLHLDVQNPTKNENSLYASNICDHRLIHEQVNILQKNPDYLMSFLQNCQQILQKEQQNISKGRVIQQKHHSNPFYDLKRLFNAHFHTKRTHVIPTNTVFCLQFASDVVMAQASPNGQNIVGVSSSNSMKLIKVKHKKAIKSKNEDKNQNLTALCWINNSLFVTGNEKGVLKVYKNDFQLCKTFKADQSKITHIVCSDNIIYAKSASKLVLATMQNGVFQDFIVPDIDIFVKPKHVDCIIGISSKSSVKIFDFKLKQFGILNQLKCDRILSISLSNDEKSFFITAVLDKQLFIDNYTLSGTLIKRVSPNNRTLKSQEHLSLSSLTELRGDRSLYAVTFVGSSKIHFLSQQTGNYIFEVQAQSQQQYVNKEAGLKVRYLSQKEMIVLNGCFLNIYSQTKQVYKKIETKKVPKIPTQLAMFVRTLRDRHPQALNIELFQSILNQEGIDQESQSDEDQENSQIRQDDFDFHDY